MLNKIKKKLKKIYYNKTNVFWIRRAKKYGARSVINLAHAEDQFENVTKRQMNILFPLLNKCIKPTDKSILDFGCGPGRFTGSLAQIIKGIAYGVDPISQLLEIAPISTNVLYRRIINQKIPIKSGTIDICWICLVLGGLSANQIVNARNELIRVIKNDGLIFLIEITVDDCDDQKSENLHWNARTIEYYTKLFEPYAELEVVGSYIDVGERVSVFAGRVFNQHPN